MIWDPWEAPSNELEDAMIRVAGKAGAVRQLLRSQVIEELLQIDKMDMHAVKFPTVWARLCSPLFKEGEHR